MYWYLFSLYVLLPVDLQTGNKLFIPYDRLVKKGRVIYGQAIEISPQSVTVKLNSNGTEEIVEFDELIIALGSSNRFPFKMGDDSTVGVSADQWKELLREFNNRLKQVDDILVCIDMPVYTSIQDIYVDKDSIYLVSK